MSTEIFQKEAEFHKLNLELEMRAQALMDEVDLVMKNQQNQQEKDSKSRKFNGTIFPEIYSTEEDYFYERPASNNGSSVPSSTTIQQNFAKFLKIKMKKMQDEVKQLQTDYKRKCEIVRKVQGDNKLLEDERVKLQQQLQSATESVSRHEVELQTLAKKYSVRETENNCLRREIDSLKKDLRSQTSLASSNEIKLNRTLEEIERLKSTIKELRVEAKELRETGSKEIQEIRIKNKRLENQKADLTNAVKKQSLLIDNLRKQKLHLEASRMLNITEEEFIKILDWNLAEKRETIINEKNHRNKSDVLVTAASSINSVVEPEQVDVDDSENLHH